MIREPAISSGHSQTNDLQATEQQEHPLDGLDLGKTPSEETINLLSEIDRERLSVWCEFHFEHTIQRGIRSYNAPSWHECCLALSKRGFTRKCSHSLYHSCSILRVPGFKNIRNHVDFREWIVEKIEAHTAKFGQAPFPAVNIAHRESHSDWSMPWWPLQYDDSHFKTRFHDLVERQRSAETKIKELLKENLRLHSSVKWWYRKYEALLPEAEENHELLPYETPKKPLQKELSESYLSF